MYKLEIDNIHNIFNFILKNKNIEYIINFSLISKEYNNVVKKRDLDKYIIDTSINMHSCFFLSITGLLYNYNNYNNYNNIDISKIENIKNITNISSISTIINNKIYNHCMFKTYSNRVYGFGKSLIHQLYNNFLHTNCFSFNDDSLIKIYESEFKIKKIITSYYFSLIHTDKYLWLIGDIPNLNLNNYKSAKESIIKFPIFIDLIKNEIIDIVCGYSHVLLLTIVGNIWSFGKGNQGQLGSGLYKSCKFPRMIKNFKNIISIHANGNHSCALDKNNSLWVWGNNSNYQLGINMNKIIYKPLNVLKNVDYFSAGLNQNCILYKNKLIIIGKNKSKKLKKININKNITNIKTNYNKVFGINQNGDVFFLKNDNFAKIIIL